MANNSVSLEAPAPRAQANISRDLEVMGAADNYYQWMLDEIRPHLGSRVLECGSGRGTLTARLLELRLDRVVASDFDEDYLPGLRAICSGRDSAAVILLDLEQPAESSIDRLKAEKIDSIVMINVLEHISSDERCLASLARALPSGGRIIVFAPAFPLLFSALDESYGHYRRYTKRMMRRLAERVGMRTTAMHYVNFPGFFAWLILYKLFRGTQLGNNSVSIFNRLTPMVRKVESVFRPPLGLSVVTVFEKR